MKDLFRKSCSLLKIFWIQTQKLIQALGMVVQDQHKIWENVKHEDHIELLKSFQKHQFESLAFVLRLNSIVNFKSQLWVSAFEELFVTIV